MILDQHALAKVQHEQYTAKLSSSASEIDRLVLLVEKLQRMLFGAKSEKVLRQIEQLELQLEELGAASAIEEQKTTTASDRTVPARPFRRPLPQHLPREIHTHLPDHVCCPDCDGRLRELGEDVAEIAGARASLPQGHPPCASEAELRSLRPHRAGIGAVQAHRPRSRRSRTARPCAGLQVRRPSSALSAGGDLRP